MSEKLFDFDVWYDWKRGVMVSDIAFRASAMLKRSGQNVPPLTIAKTLVKEFGYE